MDLDAKIEYLKRLAPAERKIQQKKLEAKMGVDRGTLDEKFVIGRPAAVASVPTPVSTPVPGTPVVEKKPKRRWGRKKKKG